MKLKDEILKKIAIEEKDSACLNSIKEMGFEVVGDIAIIELHDCPEDVLKNIAKLIRSYHPNIGVVVRKVSDISGAYRVGSYELIELYERKIINKLPKQYRNLSPFETLHIEHRCRFLLDISKVYFSSKLGFERKRIEQQVREGEKIAVLFAGIGPFAIVIAKHKNVSIDAVELNPYAISYFKKNLELNKLKGKIGIIQGDVGEWVEHSDLKSYDRIVMPAPKDAPTYLEKVTSYAKKKTIIHYYCFVDKESINKTVSDLEHNFKVKVLAYRLAGSVGTNQYRLSVDLEVM